MKIGVIGSGAIGAFYGARLLKAGHDVHFLFHSDIEYVRLHGLRVDSVDGDMYFPQVHAYGGADEMPVCDLVLVATKTTTNDLLAQLLAPICKAGTIVVLMQNGLNGERKIAGLNLGVEIVGCLCFVCCNKIGPGHIAHIEYGKVTLGHYRVDEKPAGRTPVLQSAGEIFKSAGLAVEMCDDLLLARWRKLFWNIPYNGLCSLLGATTDQLMANQGMRELLMTLMQEVRSGAKAVGRDIPQEYIQEIMRLTDNMAPYKPSMMLDAEAGRPLEVEAIYGEPLRTVEAFGVPCPCIRTLYLQLCFMNASLREERNK